jgi:hypothetical protein
MARSSSISQDAFFVAPQLIGLPLASGKRRLVAMLLDLLFVAILVNLGGGTLLGLAAAAFLFRIATRGAASRIPRLVRIGVAVVGAVLVVTTVSSLWDSAAERLKAGSEVAVSAGGSAATAADGVPAVAAGKLGPMAAIGMTTTLVSIQKSESEAEVRRLAPAATSALRRAGQDDETIRDLYAGMAEDDELDRPWLLPALLSSLPADSAAAQAAPVPRASPDSLAGALAAALRARSADTAALKRALVPVVAHDTLAALDERIGELTSERREARAELTAARAEVEAYQSRGLVSTIAKVADEMGLGFGWTGLYFTAFLALWRGQTPGKRLLGIRVMRLNGEKMTFWASFERFGGYAASIFTGLLGFVQILWDRNRQGIHDKIVETVVVRDFGNLLAPNVPAVPDRVAVTPAGHAAAGPAHPAWQPPGVAHPSPPHAGAPHPPPPLRPNAAAPYAAPHAAPPPPPATRPHPSAPAGPPREGGGFPASPAHAMPAHAPPPPAPGRGSGAPASPSERGAPEPADGAVGPARSGGGDGGGRPRGGG